MSTESELTKCGLFSKDADYIAAITHLAKVLCALPVGEVHAELEDYAITMFFDLSIAFMEVDPEFSAELKRLSGADNGEPGPIGAKVAAAKSEIATCSAFCAEREYAIALHRIARALATFGVQAVHEEIEVECAPRMMSDLDIAIAETAPEFHAELERLRDGDASCPLRQQNMAELARKGIRAPRQIQFDRNKLN